MLQLTQEQTQLVDGLQARRQASAITGLLATVWPAVADQLQGRWPDFIAAATLRASQLGLSDIGQQARYAALCCLWGSSFEDRPGFEWAAALCADDALGAALRLHQLEHQSRQRLASRQHAVAAGDRALSSAAFDQALSALDAGLSAAVCSRSIYIVDPPLPRQLACDLSAVGYGVVEPADLFGDRLQEGIWQRVQLAPGAPAPPVVTAPLHTPRQVAALSRPAGAGVAARLQIASSMLSCCGSRHPEVVHTSASGRVAWQGAASARLSLPLHPAPAMTADAGLAPSGIGHGDPPDLQTVQVHSCGIRDAGAAMCSVALAVQVHDAKQQLLQIRHGPAADVAAPAGEQPQPPATADAQDVNTTLCRLEADGQLVAAPSWLRDWQRLQVAAAAGLDKLFNAWNRAMADGSSRMQAQLSPLVGQAALAWGWQHTPSGAVAMRAQGSIDFMALVLDLTLSGKIDFEGQLARVQLRATGRAAWKIVIDEPGQDGEAAAQGPQGLPAPGLAKARCTWRHACVLAVDALATGDPALLSAAPLPEALRGALVGECGLRLRPDGQGWQWFYRLVLEPVQARLLCHDAIGGTRCQQRELLPALTLIDWSAG